MGAIEVKYKEHTGSRTAGAELEKAGEWFMQLLIVQRETTMDRYN